MLRRIFTRSIVFPSASILTRNLFTYQTRFKFTTNTLPNFATSDAEGEEESKYWTTWEKGIKTLNDSQKKPLTEDDYVKLCREIPYLDIQELDNDSTSAVKYVIENMTQNSNNLSVDAQLDITYCLAFNNGLNIEPWIIPYWRNISQYFLDKFSSLKFSDKLRIIGHYSIINFYDAKTKELVEKCIESLKWTTPEEYGKLPPTAIFVTANSLRQKGWGDTLFINTLCVLAVRNKRFWGMRPRLLTYFLLFLEEEKHEPHIQLLIQCTERVLKKLIDQGKFNTLKATTKLIRDTINADHVNDDFKLKLEEHFIKIFNDKSQPKDIKTLITWLNIFGRYKFQIPEIEGKIKDLIFELWNGMTDVELAHILWLLSWKKEDNMHHIKMVLIKLEDKIRNRQWIAPQYLELIMIELNNSKIFYPRLMKTLEDIAFAMLMDEETNVYDLLTIVSCFPPHVTTNPQFHEKAAQRLSSHLDLQNIENAIEEINKENKENTRYDISLVEIEEEDIEHKMYGYSKEISKEEEEVRYRELQKIIENNKKNEFWGFGRDEEIKQIEEIFSDEKLDEAEFWMDFITTVCENQYLQKPAILRGLEGSIQDKLVVMNEYNMFRVIYAFLKLNCASNMFYQTCIELLQMHMRGFAPIPTAKSSFAFGMVGKEEFFTKLYEKIKEFITSNEVVRVETYYGTIFRFRGMMSPYFEFNDRFPALALAEMLWGLAAFEVKDKEIWNTKLYEIALKIPGIEVDAGITKWSRSRDYSPKELYSSLGPFDYGLLMQALALNPPKSTQQKSFLNKLKGLLKEKSENFIKNMGLSVNVRKDFVEGVKEAARSLNLDMDDRERNYLGMKLDLKIGTKEILLYDKDHYLYQSEGYERRSGDKNLFKYWIMKRKILEAAEIPFVEIYQGDWEKMLPEEREEFLHNEYKRRTKHE